MQILFVCPKHPDVVLFRENPDRLEVVRIAEPVECPKCKRHYYKRECRSPGGVKPLGTPWVDES